MAATDNLETRIAAAIARALGIPGDGATPLAMGATPGWDSIGHMTVVMELEAEFATSFPAYRLPDLVDVPSIARVLRESPPAR
jgi:acyl carrier protein